jgi:hypothetical protein
MKKSLLWFLGFCFLAANAYSQPNPAAYTVQAEATVRESPSQITLHWKRDPNAQQIEISKRRLGEHDWNDLGSTNSPADTTFADDDVQPGILYEYEILDSAMSDSVYAAFGFVVSGIDVQYPFSPGKVILLVDNTYSTPLASEIARWISDLEAEGWGVIRHDVNRTDAIPAVKALVKSDYLADSTHIRSLFILGHVPVPYSGDIAPDGHVPGSGNHQGAWPTDVYYGNFYTKWTDTQVNDITAYDPRNQNIPGDGKFDQDTISADKSPMQLEVGRVDLYDMPSFTLSDTALLKQYLDRDHTFRMGQLQVPKRALINDNFGIIEGGFDVPGSNGWRNFAPLVGTNNIFDFHQLSSAGDWFGYLDTAKYLWAYGCGGGSWSSCGGVGVTSQYASAGSQSVFNMLFGSFFGDWDHSDGLLRAPLATSYGLTCCWAGRPYWYFHPLGMGETFGYCAKLSQNVSGQGFFTDASDKHIAWISDYIWSFSMSGVHVALMGDPTLRMQYLSAPPTAFSASVTGSNTVRLFWTAPQQTVEGYNIYRAASTSGTFQKINTSLVTSTSFTDASPLNDSNIYAVRAARLTTTPSGSYYDESGGAMQGVRVTLSGVDKMIADAVPSLQITEDGAFIDLHVAQSTTSAERISIVDITGREVAIVTNSELLPGSYSYRVNATSFSAGIYFVRMASSNGIVSTKFILTR